MVKDNLDGAVTFNNNDIFTFPYVVNFTDDSRPARFIDVGHFELKSYFYKSELCFGSEYLYFPFHVCINRDFRNSRPDLSRMILRRTDFIDPIGTNLTLKNLEAKDKGGSKERREESRLRNGENM